jgi:hypothetical protein
MCQMFLSFVMCPGKCHLPLAAPLLSTAPDAESKKFPVTLLAAIVLLTAGWLGIPLPALAAPPVQVLSGHVPAITKQLTPARRLDSGASLDLAIGLPLRNREQLTNLLQALSQPSSPNFRHYLTPDQFTASFGPSQADYQAVADFAKSRGLLVKGTHPNRTLLDVSGSVAAIENAFHVKMLVYQHPVESRTFFAPDVEPSLDLNTPVLAVSGLDNYKKPRPHLNPLLRPLRRGGGGGGGGGGSGPYGYLGSDFRNAYAPNVSLDGTGQSVGLFELSGYDNTDITTYEDEAGYSYVNVTNIYIDNFDGDDSQMDYAVEVTSDIEMAIAMAPGLANVYVYEGPTPQDVPPVDTNDMQSATTTAQINDVFNRMATDNLAGQLSCSYGLDVNSSTVQIFQQYAAQGQSFFLASGDNGAYPGAIDSPADDPYITVVGGTTLSTDSQEYWTSETVWLTPPDPFFGTPENASGGGVSFTYAIPSWQQGISMTANQGSTTMRNLPDVAMVANGVDIVWGDDYPLLDSSTDLPEAGTSLAAPLWAGFMAMVNQQAAANGQPPIGFANPPLYAIAKSTNYHSCFHDVTTGNSFTPGSPSKYSATPGFDLCTGWGTPNGNNLIQALLAPPGENLVITSPLGFTSSGPGGGPYSVTSQTFTLKNTGSTMLNWSVVNTSGWLNVSSTRGTLSPGGSCAVNVSLNSTANNFLIGNYSGNVSFVNLTDGMTQNRQFDLDVGNGGFETGDFTDWTFFGDPGSMFVVGADDADVAGEAVWDGAVDAQFVHSGLYGAYLGESDNGGTTPPIGSLSQTLATTVGRQYLVSFWLSSVPYTDGSTTPSSFAALWNGSTLWSQTNLPAFGWTNLQFVVPATATHTTLEFDNNNVNAAFALDDVSVQTVPPPVFQSVSMSSSNLTFTWSAIANQSYQIQATGNLDNPNWTNVTAVLTASNNIVSTSAFLTNAPQQFYRVKLMLPP